MSEKYQKSLYNGCYPSSKQYLGIKKANVYCSCVIKNLSNKYTDVDMDHISKQNEKTQMEAYGFASDLCGKFLKN